MNITSYVLSAFIAIAPVGASAESFFPTCLLANFKDGVETTHDLSINMLSATHDEMALIITSCLARDAERPVSMEWVHENIDTLVQNRFDTAKEFLEKPPVEIK